MLLMKSRSIDFQNRSGDGLVDLLPLQHVKSLQRSSDPPALGQVGCQGRPAGVPAVSSEGTFTTLYALLLGFFQTAVMCFACIFAFSYPLSLPALKSYDSIRQTQNKEKPNTERDQRENVLQSPHFAGHKRVENTDNFPCCIAQLNTRHITGSW